ncbi:MAG: type II toxin-antitoxin system RelE/ParE family toxin [Vicinamibacterales bacterium]
MAAYRIELKPSAARQLETLPRDLQRRIARKIDSLAEDPRQAGSHKLSGSDGLYRVRVSDYRIVYQIRDALLLVLVLKIGHRREVYR